MKKNKRNLKKTIKYLCGDLAAEVILASYIAENVDKTEVSNIISDIASLQTDAVSKVTFSYEKTQKDFPTVKEYRKAHRTYCATAYRTLCTDINTKVGEILKKMNALFPAEVRAKCETC